MSEGIVPRVDIESKILLIRGYRVMLDSALADIYGTSTKRLNEQVFRNRARFPGDFMFQLTRAEYDSLRSQFATSKGRGGRRYLPYVFTEYGCIHAANVVNTEIAIQASIAVVRAFVRLRQLVFAHRELAEKLSELERKVAGQDAEIRSIVGMIRELMEGMSQDRPGKECGPMRRIGFSP
ncbi:MAG: ORF6N domain-containing protein [Elusimicrobia bacterium]|nr:ORF6N domain-containing protein [Elusimicrobiota bacterium]